MARLDPAAAKTDGAAALEAALFALWLCGMSLSPVWFGSNMPIAWGANALLFGSLLAAYGALSLIGSAPTPMSLRRLALPLAALGLALLWAEIQTLTSVAPAWQDPVWRMASAALGEPVAGTISAYPPAGHRAILWTASVAACFILAVQFGRDPRRARLTIGAAALTGGAIAAYGIAIYATGNHWVLWQPKHAYLEALTATFINRNTCAAYCGVSLICALGLMLAPWPRPRLVPLAPLLVAALLLSAALVLTGSRAGMIVTALGIVTLAGLRIVQRGRHATLAVAGALLAAAMLAVLVFAVGAHFIHRLARFDSDFAYRLAIDRRLLAGIEASPWLGHGYGAFEFAFPRFRDWTLAPYGRWEYAHNDWLEALFTLGVPAGLLLWFVVAWILTRCGKAALSGGPMSLYGAIALSAGILTITHSLVDFILQIQGFALPLTGILGIGVAQSWPRAEAALTTSRGVCARLASPRSRA